MSTSAWHTQAKAARQGRRRKGGPRQAHLLACCALLESSSCPRIFLTESRRAPSVCVSCSSSALPSWSCFSVLAKRACCSLSAFCFSLRLGSASLSTCCAFASASFALFALLITSSISPLMRSQLLCASLLAFVLGNQRVGVNNRAANNRAARTLGLP